ncbi:hypothetical protein [Paenibacillus sp. P13VS]|nr:hypothetical protein [Paenibacillus sp. P13VS]
MIEVAVPRQRWEIEFLEDGSVEVDKFISHKDIYDAIILLKELSN